jgi:hypothetical protein
MDSSIRDDAVVRYADSSWPSFDYSRSADRPGGSFVILAQDGVRGNGRQGAILCTSSLAREAPGLSDRIALAAVRVWVALE